MPNPSWNLEEDLKDAAEGPAVAWPIAQPFSGVSAQTSVTVESVSLENRGDRRVIAVVTNPQDAEVYAMARGEVEPTTTGVILRVRTFFCNPLLIAGSRARWFLQWLFAPIGTIPTAIHYDNVEMDNSLIAGKAVEPGHVIGRGRGGPVDMWFEYDSTRIGSMVELLGLFFWRREHDPLYVSNPPDYPHPLAKAMALHHGAGLTGNAREKPDWLGLRPPLRTYQRVEWEARHTHWFHHAAWQRGGNLADKYRNPLVTKDNGEGRPLKDSPKCNVFAGEMAFRAGFRTLTSGAVRPFNYVSNNTITQFTCDAAGCVGMDANLGGTVKLQNTHYKRIPFATRRWFKHGDPTDISALNTLVQEEGRVILHAVKQHCQRKPSSSSTLDFLTSSGGKTSGRCPGAMPLGIDPVYGNKEDFISENQTDYDAYKAIGYSDAEAYAKTVADWKAKHSLELDGDSLDYDWKSFHVILVAHVTGIEPNRLSRGSRGLDQHCNSQALGVQFFTTAPMMWTQCVSSAERCFLELIPGGDPDQAWGVIDLNCLVPLGEGS